MIDHLWQSTLFALVIAAMVPIFRKQSAGLRFWLWFAASAKFLIPLSLLVRLGGYLPALPAPAQALIAPASKSFAAPLLIAPPAHVLPTAEIAALVWALGVLCVAGLWLMRWRNLCAVLRDAPDLDMATPVPVKLVASYLEPGLVGIWRPVILMPRGVAERLSPCEMRAVLAHELSHHRRRDNLLACAQMLVEMLFWFHPLVWWIGARLVAEREQACDEAVLDTGNAPRTYAEGILKICRFHLQPGLACTAGVSGGDLKSRVHAIMADQGREALDGQRILLLGTLSLATVMLPLLAGAPGSAPVNALARQMASVLSAPHLPQMAFAAPPVMAAPVAKRVTRSRAAAAPVAAAPAPIAEPLAPAAPVVESQPPSQTVIVTEVRPALPLLEEETVCRKPQPLPGSRLLGPSVCLKASEWAELAAQGKDVSPNGRVYVVSASAFERKNSLNPPSCVPQGTGGATTAMGGLARAVCF
jgi:beta-lactamase regulating signal transducer with metallopeptidase domain